MSKRDLKKYLGELNKEQLEEQIIELYEKFSPVKTYYDFVFNPKEDRLNPVNANKKVPKSAKLRLIRVS